MEIFILNSHNYRELVDLSILQWNVVLLKEMNSLFGRASGFHSMFDFHDYDNNYEHLN